MDVPGRFGRGVWASARLTGLQTYIYYLNDYEDSLAIKLLVAAIWSFPVCIPNFLPDTEDFPALGIGSGECALDFCSPMFANHRPNFSFFAHQIYHLCRPRVKWWVTAPIGLAWVSAFRSWEVYWYSNRQAESAVLEYPNLLVNPKISVATQMTVVLLISDLFYGMTPSGSGSALSRTKRLLNTLIIYAVNRCLLILLVAITALVMAVEGQDTWFLGPSFVIGRSSLNSREHLRSKGSGTLPDPRIGVTRFANPPKVLGDIEKFKDGARQVDVPEEDVIDITIYAVPDKTTKLYGEEKV
ncbi:hypothetical protein EV401DRAFT_1895478 [Pisolithus croceorrhizus]|nr:hypothetical protein EV401DRAFT_1895478 [Pisolithus croceorrhizus]